jgi:hypothetical protein
MFAENKLLDIFIDEMPVQLECPALGCAWKSQPLSEAVALEMWKDHSAGAHGHQAAVGGAARDGGGEGCDDGDGGAFHDEEENHLSGWSNPNTNLQEIPQPMLQGTCSQEDFKFFKRNWMAYVRYHEKVDAGEIREELWNCLSTELKLFVYRDLGSNVDTATQDEMLRVIELLVVEDLENYVYENPGKQVVLDMDNVVLVDEEQAVMVVPQVDI